MIASIVSEDPSTAATPIETVTVSGPVRAPTLKGLAETLRHMRSAIFGSHFGIGVGQHDDEFLAADSADHVDIADRLLEAGGELLQHAVADIMAVLVVHRFEVIDIERQQRQRSCRD